MTRFLKITGIVLLALLLLLVTAPFLFKGKIEEVVKREVNKEMNIQIDFDKLGLSFFKNFPHATVSLQNLSVVGKEAFAGDTLVFANDLSATVNLKSLWGDSGYELTKISVNNALVQGIINPEGKANWEIMDDDGSDDSSDPDDSDFKLQLKDVSISNTTIRYVDQASNMSASLEDINLKLKGDMTADETTLSTQVNVAAFTFIMDKIPYISRAAIDIKADILANLKDMRFTLKENTLKLNEIQASIDGWVAMNEDESMDMDIKLNAPTTQFKDILSMIPAIYANDFKDIKTSGEVTLAAFATGTMKEELMPAFDVQLTIANAMFQYPDLPKAVTGIRGAIRIANPGGVVDKTSIAVSNAHFNLGGNPFDLNLSLKTPVSDPDIDLSAVGKIDLGMIKDIYPMEETELNGILDANLQVNTRMSYIEKEQYENVNAAGSLRINDMLVNMEEMDAIHIQNALLTFSPRYVDLSSFNLQIGKNDIAANGKLENFIPYFLKDETLKGNLSVSSNYLNLNDFMTDTEATEAQAADTTVLLAFEVPKNIDFNLNGNFKEILFDKLEMRNVNGRIIVNNGKVEMQNLTMNALGGKMNVSGYYDTSKDPKQPEVNLDMNIQEASFAQTFSTFTTVQKLAPILESLLGNYSTSLKLNSLLSNDFMPILSSIDANGLLKSQDVSVQNNAVLTGLASALNNESLKTMSIKDLNLPFTISDGKITTSPFDVKFGSGSMNLSGSTGLDQSIDYLAKVNLAGSLSNKYVQNVDVKIGGTFTSPKFSLDLQSTADQVLGNLASSILGNDTTGASLSTQVTEKVNEEIEKQIESIRKQAANTGEKLKDEAKKQGDKLIEEAKKTSNPLAKVAAVKAAEAAAKKLNEEAEKQALKLTEEADKQIENLQSRSAQ